MDEERLMREAISLAVPTRPHPNPRVGRRRARCRRGEWWRGPPTPVRAQPHAEAAGPGRPPGSGRRGGTLVVTLEPCDHTGRTPPCTAAILAVGRVAGAGGGRGPRLPRGGARAGPAAGRRPGGALRDRRPAEAEALDPGYFHHRRTGRPRVTLKAALTLDGQAAAADGTSQWITSAEARADAHRLRAAADAVMVGAGTLAADDPHPDGAPARLRRAPAPAGGGGGAAPAAPGRPPLGAAALWSWPRRPSRCRARSWWCPGPDGVDLGRGLAALGERGLLDLLVEGGPTLAGAAAGGPAWWTGGSSTWAARLRRGPGLPALAGRFATLAAAREVEIVSAGPVGPDLRVEFIVKEH